MEAYAQQWRKLQRARTGLFLWTFGGVLLGVAVLTVTDYENWPDGVPILAAVAAMGVWLTGMSYFYFQVMFFRCPRCKSIFASRGTAAKGRSWTPRRACAKCGLKRFEDPQEAASEQIGAQ
jgi:hypothetical protein